MPDLRTLDDPEPSDHDEGDPEELVQMGSRVWLSRRERNEFKRRFPVYGAANYIFEQTIRELLRLTDGDPVLTDRVKEAMRNTMQEKLAQFKK